MDNKFTVETVKQIRLGDTFYIRFKEAQKFFVELHNYIYQAYLNDDDFIDLDCVSCEIVEDIETLMNAFNKDGICILRKTE